MFKDKQKLRMYFTQIPYLSKIPGWWRWRLLKNERDFDISGLEKGTKFKNKGENKKHKYYYIYKLITSTFQNLLSIYA